MKLILFVEGDLTATCVSEKRVVVSLTEKFHILVAGFRFRGLRGKPLLPEERPAVWYGIVCLISGRLPPFLALPLFTCSFPSRSIIAQTCFK